MALGAAAAAMVAIAGTALGAAMAMALGAALAMALPTAVATALAAWATVPAVVVATARPMADPAVTTARRVHCLWHQQAAAGAG